MRAVDTNVLIYVHDPRSPVKQVIAANLVQGLTDGVLLWQVACEYINASRKLAAFGFDQQKAWQALRELQTVWETLLPSWAVMTRAEQLLQKYSLSFWDAMIVAACLGGSVTHLYTEDFGGQPEIEGLKIVNPFYGNLLNFPAKGPSRPAEQSETPEESRAPEEKGLWDYLDEGTEALDKLSDLTEKINEQNLVIADKVESHGARITTIKKIASPSSAKQIRQVCLQIAADMNSFSKNVEALMPGLDQAMNAIDENFTGLIRLMDPSKSSDEEKRQVVEFRIGVASILEGSRSAGKSFQGLRDTVAALTGITKEVNQASRRQARVLDDVVNKLTRVESASLSVIFLIDEKFGSGGSSEGI